MKTIQRVLLVLIVLGLGLIVAQKLWVPPTVNWLLAHTDTPAENMPVVVAANHDPLNTTYVIDGTSVTLVQGKAEAASAPGSASKTVTMYFGNEARGDLNGDGVADTALILTQTTGGSGVFYYAVVALQTKDGYKGTNAILLGDRIAPQATEIKNAQAIFNYADRTMTEPMTAPPSVGKSLYLSVVNGKLQTVPAH